MRQKVHRFLSLDIGLCFLVPISLAHILQRTLSWNRLDMKFCSVHFDQETISVASNMTFISVPRPWSNASEYRRIKLVVGSWLGSSPKSKVLFFVSPTQVCFLFSFRSEFSMLFGSNRLHLRPGLKLHRLGHPLIRDWFVYGTNHAEPSTFLTFINADILILDGWVDRVSQIYEALESDYHPIVVARRLDITVKELSDADVSSHLLTHSIGRSLRAFAHRCPHQFHGLWGFDSFTFRRPFSAFNFSAIPDFVMGFVGW
jgi:hypothetical protein